MRLSPIPTFRLCTSSVRVIPPLPKLGTMLPYDTIVRGRCHVPHHVYYQLAILGLLWLCVILHYAWPSRYPPSPPKLAEPVPIMCKRKRSNEPKPFEGLTHKPHWAACEHDTTHPPVPPPRGPDPMSPTHRRPRAIDTSRHFCPRAGGWGTFARMAILAVACGASCTVALVKDTFWRRTARSSMANGCRWS